LEVLVLVIYVYGLPFPFFPIFLSTYIDGSISWN